MGKPFLEAGRRIAIRIPKCGNIGVARRIRQPDLTRDSVQDSPLPQDKGYEQCAIFFLALERGNEVGYGEIPHELPALLKGPQLFGQTLLTGEKVFFVAPFD